MSSRARQAACLMVSLAVLGGAPAGAAAPNQHPGAPAVFLPRAAREEGAVLSPPARPAAATVLAPGDPPVALPALGISSEGSARGTGHERVSRRKAFLLSLLLPGLGQRANGDYGRARLFFGAEAAIWIAAGSFRIVGGMREEDYRQFAAIRAGANTSQDSEDYFQLVADYSSSDDYNVAVRQDARAIYPNDREQQLIYVERHSISPDRGWRWPDEDTQWEFRYIRHDALSAKRMSVLLTGWAVVNRVVAAVEAARAAGGDDSAQAGRASGSRLNIGLVPPADGHGVCLQLTRSF